MVSCVCMYVRRCMVMVTFNICSGNQVSRTVERQNVMCTPIRRWNAIHNQQISTMMLWCYDVHVVISIPAQFKQINTPNGILAQVGFLLGQSKHVYFTHAHMDEHHCIYGGNDDNDWRVVWRVVYLVLSLLSCQSTKDSLWLFDIQCFATRTWHYYCISMIEWLLHDHSQGIHHIIIHEPFIISIGNDVREEKEEDK